MDIHKINNLIKVYLSGRNGIPYALLDSYGDYIFNTKENKILSYAEFCDKLIDAKERIKYLPLLNFFLKIINNGLIDFKKIKRIRSLLIILKVLRKSNLEYYKEVKYNKKKKLKKVRKRKKIK